FESIKPGPTGPGGFDRLRCRTHFTASSESLLARTRSSNAKQDGLLPVPSSSRLLAVLGRWQPSPFSQIEPLEPPRILACSSHSYSLLFFLSSSAPALFLCDPDGESKAVPAKLSLGPCLKSSPLFRVESGAGPLVPPKVVNQGEPL